MRLSRLLFSVVFFVSASPLGADDAQSQSPERPRIALVLSGGGAAGVAHVGVIKELERLGVRPDIVTGTSMGAVVGGLYASGFTTADLERAVTEIDWTRILDDASERDLIQPQRRDNRLDPFSIQTDLPIGIGPDGPKVSAGLVDGVKLTLILRELTYHVDGVDDFDQLSIPFRAVATDLLSAQPVVLGDGDLSVAMRASMSIPGFFPPVKIDGKTLVDGGVTNNLPIDVARDLGADIVIASFIPPAKASEEDVDSLSGALGQSMAIFIHARSRALISTLSGDDVLLTPGVEDVGMLAFDKAPDTIDAGVAAVQANAAAINRLAALREPLAPRPEIGDTASATIRYDRIEVRYDGRLDPEIIRRRLDLPDAGDVTPKDVERGVRRVYGLELFENVTYRLERAGGERTLVVTAKQLNQGLLKPRVGLAVSDVFGDDGEVTIAAGATLPEINSRGGRFDIDVALGQNDGVRLQFEQPVDRDLEFFIGAEASYLRQNATLFQALDTPLSEIDVEELGGEASFAWSPGSWGGMGVALGYNHLSASVEAGVIPGARSDSINEDELLGSFIFFIDTADDVDLQTSGVQMSARVGYDLLQTDSAGEIAFDGVYAYSFGRNTVAPYAFLVGQIETDDFNPNFIGGFPVLPGFDDNELLGNIVGAVGLRYYRRLSVIPFFGSDAFYGGSLAYGGAYQRWGDVLDEDGGFVSSSLFAGVETSFGPAIISFGAAEQGQFTGAFTLGARF